MATELVFDKKPKFIQSLTDSWLMIKRSSTHIVRNRDQVLGTFFQPIMFLILFSAVFGGAISKTLAPGTSYLNFLLAGIIVQTIAFGSTTTAVAVCNDLQKGIVDRFRSLPMANIAVLNGHVVSDLFRNAISTAVMIIVGLIMGFRSSASALEWLYIIGLVLLFTLAFSWLSAIIGVVSKSVEAVQWLTFVIIFPLTFASAAFVNPETMPKYLQIFAVNQPITHVIEAIRSLMLGTPIGDHGWLAVIWCIGILAVATPLASNLFKNKTSN